MGMTDVLRAQTMADLLGAVPALFGFHPQDSLVAMCVGPAKRIGFRLRIDLPPADSADTVADQLVGFLTAQEPDAVALVVYAGADGDQDARAVAEAMASRLADCDVRVVDAVRYDGERYYSYVCTDPTCCPPEGVACDVTASPLLAEAVFRGQEILADRDAVVRRFEPVTGAQRDEASRAIAAEASGLGLRGGLGHAQDDLELIQRGIDRTLPIVDRFLASYDDIGGGLLTVQEKATLAVWTTLTFVRDVLWCRISPQNAAASLALWREVATSAIPPFAPAPLTLAAFSAWLHGDGVQAQSALDRVAETAPDYSMAELIQSALASCIDPRTWAQMPLEDILAAMPGLRASTPPHESNSDVVRGGASDDDSA